MLISLQRYFFPILTTIFLLYPAATVTAQVRNSPAPKLQKMDFEVTNNTQAFRMAREYADQAYRNIQDNRYNEAIENYQAAIRLAPNDALLFNNLGTVYARRALYEDAIVALQRAVELDPKLVWAHFNLSVVFDHLQRHKEALAAVTRAVEMEPRNVKAKTQLCELSLILEKHKEAIACYEDMQGFSPLNEKAQLNYGFALMRDRQFKKALPIFQDYARVMPENPTIHNAIGVISFNIKRYEEAVAAFNRALELDSTLTEVQFNLAVTELANKNKNGAIRQYSRIKLSNPDLAQKLYWLIYGDKLVLVGAKQK